MESRLRLRLSLVGSIVAAVAVITTIVEFDPHLAWLVISIREGRGDSAHLRWHFQVGNGGGARRQWRNEGGGRLVCGLVRELSGRQLTLIIYVNVWVAE